jgi:hypothetical protein
MAVRQADSHKPYIAVSTGWWLPSSGLASWLITVIAMAPPAILGVVAHLAVGLGNPDRQPPAKAMSVGAAPTKAQASDPVNAIDEAVTRDSRRPDQQRGGVRALVGSAVPAGSVAGDTNVKGETDGASVARCEVQVSSPGRWSSQARRRARGNRTSGPENAGLSERGWPMSAFRSSPVGRFAKAIHRRENRLVATTQRRRVG